MGLEGIISKNSLSPYQQRRTHDWVKTKCSKRQEFIIVGFTAPKNKRSHFGSLLLATYNDRKQLVYCGHVGTGFTEGSLKAMHKKLIKYVTKTPPLKQTSIPSKQVTWVKPTLVVEVEYAQWTKSGLLRHPSFKGIRSDKAAVEITREIPIKTSHLNKILYPEDTISKKELIEYYLAVQDWILPYIIDRPLTLLRCPEDYHHCFYQRHPKDEKSYFHVDDEQDLLQLPQLNALEIHPWGCHLRNIKFPDVVIFDLDPAEDVEWKMIVKAAKEIKKQLAILKLQCFVKTTGGKGLHIVIPIQPDYTWNQVKLFAKTFVNFLTLKFPNLYINKMQKAVAKA